MCRDTISLHSMYSRSSYLYGYLTSHTQTGLDLGTHARVCVARPRYWLPFVLRRIKNAANIFFLRYVSV